MSRNPRGWIGRLPGHNVITIDLPWDADTSASFDVPGELNFGRQLQPILPCDINLWKQRVGEYHAEGMNIAIALNADTSLGAPFAFYVDLDHSAAVPLYPISATTALSEHGEELTFTADNIVMSSSDTPITLVRATTPTSIGVTVPVDEKGTQLSGTLLLPDTPGPHPVAIIVHGSAFHQRHFYRLFAHWIVKADIGVFIYDRQGHGESTGPVDASLHTNALGVEAIMDTLAQRDDIASIGLFGISNGMWTSPLVAARRPDVAFIAGIGAPGVSMIDSEIHRRTNALAANGVSDPSVKAAGKVWHTLYSQRPTDTRTHDAMVDELEEQLTQLRNDPTVTAFTPPLYAKTSPGLSPMPSLGPARNTVANLPATISPETTYDPSESYRFIKCPILLQYGSKDPNVPAAASATLISDATTHGGNDNVVIKTYPECGHLLEQEATGLTGITAEELSYRLNGFRFASGAINDLQQWLAHTTTT